MCYVHFFCKANFASEIQICHDRMDCHIKIKLSGFFARPCDDKRLFFSIIWPKTQNKVKYNLLRSLRKEKPVMNLNFITNMRYWKKIGSKGIII